MPNLDLDVVQSRVELMLKYIARLQDLEAMTLAEYVGDFDKQLIVERLLQLLVEAASDINAYLLVEIYKLTPTSYYDSFIKAGAQGIIPLAFAQELAQSSGLRDRLVHQYEEIDNQIVFRAIGKACKQFPQYVRYVLAYLEPLEAG